MEIPQRDSPPSPPLRNVSLTRNFMNECETFMWGGAEIPPPSILSKQTFGMSAPFISQFSLEKNFSESPKLQPLKGETLFHWGWREQEVGVSKDVEFVIRFGIDLVS
ncbi:hypothetical protein CDAR_470111 [Caerostris darwini]|uniref:Uncharacterized protein n=1 Tax=Caerostris darwini TaxID=1538125 RepID=A0AAV4WAL8_9ARAC|nr:hypothetical protein CDAR_470111 [Caerostris darwini]